MPTQLQLRRGTTSQNDSFTGAVGEITVDTSSESLRIHDGSTAGGFEVVPSGAIMGFGGGAMIAKVTIDRLLAKFYKIPEYLGEIDSVNLMN